MSAPFRTSVDRRGRRTVGTKLKHHLRDYLIAECADRHFAGLRDREAARLIRQKLSRYQTGAWRRERSATCCPERHAGKLTSLLWQLLWLCDAVPSDKTVRRALKKRKLSVFRDPRFEA
jgi:hypothetical protein